MKLSAQQLEQFEREGYLFFPALFTPDEAKVLIDEVPRLGAEGKRIAFIHPSATAGVLVELTEF